MEMIVDIALEEHREVEVGTVTGVNEVSLVVVEEHIEEVAWEVGEQQHKVRRVIEVSAVSELKMWWMKVMSKKTIEFLVTMDH